MTNGKIYGTIGLRIGEDTHNKKRNSQKQIKNKGATPIGKNVIVVDEQGNEYEATYPKRAKGLVKNGRARFVGENKICLACPPDKFLEENKMENNKLTAKEIFTQITMLQRELAKNSEALLECLGDAVSLTFDNDDDDDERNYEHIEYICDAIKTREATFVRMLEMYEKMYDDIEEED